jgi:protein-arginine kinase activator protein McsA
MKCQSCDKSAVLHITELRHGRFEEEERHLCEPCAHVSLRPQGRRIRTRVPQRNALGEVRIELGRIIISEVHDQQVILLREVGGRVRFTS